MVWAYVEDDNPDIRFLVAEKKNLSEIANGALSVAYKKDEDFRLEVVNDVVSPSVDEALSNFHAEAVSQKAKAKKLTTKMLKENSGWIAAEDVYQKAKEKNISQRAIKTAKKTLGVASWKEAVSWYWGKRLAGLAIPF